MEEAQRIASRRLSNPNDDSMMISTNEQIRGITRYNATGNAALPLQETSTRLFIVPNCWQGQAMVTSNLVSFICQRPFLWTLDCLNPAVIKHVTDLYITYMPMIQLKLFDAESIVPTLVSHARVQANPFIWQQALGQQRRASSLDDRLEQLVNFAAQTAKEARDNAKETRDNTEAIRRVSERQDNEGKVLAKRIDTLARQQAQTHDGMQTNRAMINKVSECVKDHGHRLSSHDFQHAKSEARHNKSEARHNKSEERHKKNERDIAELKQLYKDIGLREESSVENENAMPSVMPASKPTPADFLSPPPKPVSQSTPRATHKKGHYLLPI